MKFALILLAVSVVYGKDLCCFPDKWHALVKGLYVDTTSDPGVIRGWDENVYFDTTNKQIREDIEVNNQTVSILVLFAKNVTYVFNEKKCYKYPAGNWSDVIHCVPASATPSPKYRLGLQPGINVVDYSWKVTDMLFSQVSVTDSCSPEKMAVVIADSGDKDAVTMAIEEFRNFVPSIPDPKVFNIPDICKELTELIPTWPLKGRLDQLKKHVFQFKH